MTSPSLTLADLTTIERDADRAPVQQLRLNVKQITMGLISLDSDGVEHAKALLLKLERLIDEQSVPGVATVSTVRGPFVHADTVGGQRNLAEPVRVAA